MIRLSALRTGRLNPPGDNPSTHFSQWQSELQGRSAAGRIKSMQNPNDTIGNRTSGIPDCNTLPRPTACVTNTSLTNERPTWCHLLFYFTYNALNMFRTLIHPSSGACDCVDELPHRSTCSQFVVCWSFCCGWYLVVFVLQASSPEDGYINVRNMLSA